MLYITCQYSFPSDLLLNIILVFIMIIFIVSFIWYCFNPRNKENTYDPVSVWGSTFMGIIICTLVGLLIYVYYIFCILYYKWYLNTPDDALIGGESSNFVPVFSSKYNRAQKTTSNNNPNNSSTPEQKYNSNTSSGERKIPYTSLSNHQSSDKTQNNDYISRSSLQSFDFTDSFRDKLHPKIQFFIIDGVRPWCYIMSLMRIVIFVAWFAFMLFFCINLTKYNSTYYPNDITKCPNGPINNN